MNEFAAKSVFLEGALTVGAPIERAFPLFSPQGERAWVPGWDPELLHPPGVEWAEGQVFRTQAELGEAVWIVSRLDRGGHRAEYYRVEPGRCVARIRVRCRALAAGSTEVVVSYEFIGLSERGNGDLAAMTEQEYRGKMERWEEWIRELLRAERE
jgi:hypothetical protein